MLALRLHFFNQRQMRAIAHIAAYGAERARRFSLLEFDDGAFGLADVLAILALAGRAVRAVAVTRPFAIPVQQRLRLVILIAVIAFFAGVQRVAALSAGGLDDLFGIIVPGGGDFHLSGVIAAGAGIVFLPASLGAGGCLGVVVHQVVFQRKQLHLSGVIAAGAGIVFLPAGLGAGGRLGVVMHQLVFQRGDFHLGGVSAALALAGVIFIPANFGAGGRLGVVVHQVVVVRVRSIPWVYISIRSLAVAVSAVCVVHGRRNAGGCGLKARAIVALNEEMCAHLSFRFVADGAATPVVFGIRIPALIRREGMCAVVLPAAGSACSQGDAGCAAVAGAAYGFHRIAAVTLAGAEMLAVVSPGLPCAPVVTEFAVLSAAPGAGFARGAGRRFGAARVKADWIALK